VTPWRITTYPRFALLVLVVAALAAAPAALLAGRLAGPGGMLAAVGGCGVSAVASLAGGLPLLLPGAAPLQAALASMALRWLVLALAATLTAVLTGWPLAPLLLSLVASHLALLAVDTGFVVGRRAATTTGATTENERKTA
jgi:hypothetical protein